MGIFFSIGYIEVPADRAETFYDSTTECLRNARASLIRRRTGCVYFRAGLFRLVSSANPLASIGSGTVYEPVVQDGRCLLRYELHFTEVAVVAGVLATLMAAWAWSIAGIGAVFVFLLVFSAIYGTNRLTGEWRFRRLIGASLS